MGGGRWWWWWWWWPCQALPGRAPIDIVVLGEVDRVAAVGVHDEDFASAHVRKLRPIRGPGRHAVIDLRAVREVHEPTPVGVHDEDVGVVVGGTCAIRRERDLLAVGRPGGIGIERGIVGELHESAPVGVHDVDLPVDVEDGSPRENDLASVRRPSSVAVLQVGAVREVHAPASVGVHDEDVSRLTVHLAPGERDLRAVRRPGRLPVWYLVARELGLIAAVCVHGPDVDVVLRVIGGVSPDDSCSVRRPVRAVVVAFVVGQLNETTAVRVHGEDLLVAAVVARVESDLPVDHMRGRVSRRRLRAQLKRR